MHTVYLVHHGNRESIEVFEIDGNANPPELTWVGCAVAPEGLTLNSVVALPDGGFATTSFQTAGLSESLDAILTGALSGAVWEWHADGGWTEVPGSTTGGPNGLEISADGEWFYIAGWGSQRFIRLSRSRVPRERLHIDLHFRPDNLRRQADGTVFASGADHFNTPEETFHVARIDPQTLTFERGDRPPRHREVRRLHHDGADRRRDLDGDEPRREDRLLPRAVALSGTHAGGRTSPARHRIARTRKQSGRGSLVRAFSS